MNAEDTIKRLIDRGHDWADKDCAANILEESRKSVRAQIALEYLKDVSSVSKAELMAEADERYMEHITAMVKARKSANIAKVNYDSGKSFVDLVRTQESTKRAEMMIR